MKRTPNLKNHFLEFHRGKRTAVYPCPNVFCISLLAKAIFLVVGMHSNVGGIKFSDYGLVAVSKKLKDLEIFVNVTSAIEEKTKD